MRQALSLALTLLVLKLFLPDLWQAIEAVLLTFLDFAQQNMGSGGW